MPGENGQTRGSDPFAGRLSGLIEKARRPLPHQPEADAAKAPNPSLPESPDAAADIAARMNGVTTPENDEFSGRLSELLAEQDDATADRDARDTEEAAAEDGVADGYSTEPVGSGEHVVTQGECMSSIAAETGHFWRTLWNDPANTELREVRADPNVLLPGDRVHVPPPRQKEELGETEMRHRFVRRGEPAMLRMRIRNERGPRANQPFQLEVDGRAHAEGTTDANGVVATPLPPGARRGKLIVGAAPNRVRYRLRFGMLNPLETPTGICERLRNLGFLCGPQNDATNEQVCAALRAFQDRHGLTPTGELDDPTREKLHEEHGN